MRTAFSFVLGCVLVIASSTVEADVRVDIGDRGSDRPVVPQKLPDGIFTLPVTFTGTTPFPKRLFGYNLHLILEPIGDARGVGFRMPYALKPSDNFVFAGAPGLVTFAVAGANPTPGPNRIFIAVNDESFENTVTVPPNVTQNAADFILHVDPDARGSYRIRVDTVLSSLHTNDPPGPGMVITDFRDVGVIEIVPEPATLPLLAAGGVLALRRRRRAA